MIPSQHFNVRSTLWINVEITLIRKNENETKSDVGFSKLHNVDTTSEPHVKTMSKRRCRTLYRRCFNVTSKLIGLLI